MQQSPALREPPGFDPHDHSLSMATAHSFVQSQTLACDIEAPANQTAPKPDSHVVLFKSPIDVTAQSHFTRGWYLFAHMISALMQKFGISLILILGYQGVITGPQPLLIFLGGYQIYMFLIHSVFGIRLILQSYTSAVRAILMASSSLTLVTVWVGSSLFTFDVIANNFGLFFLLPYLLVSLVSTVVSKGYERLFFGYDLLESLQMGVIYFKLVNGWPLSWNAALLFYGLVARVLMFLVVLFWIAFGVFVFLTCMIYYRANVTHIDLFILFLGVLFFNLIWHSYTFKFMFEGFRELLETGGFRPGNQKLNVNFTLYWASILTCVFSTISGAIVVLFFLRMRRMMLLYFKQENKISQISMTTFAQELQMRITKMSGGYFKSSEETERVTSGASADPDDDMCSVCYGKVGEVMLDPCGHSGFCVDCITNCLKERRTCPVCRQLIQAIYLVKFDADSQSYKAFGRINFE